jgi:hypothetical protein
MNGARLAPQLSLDAHSGELRGRRLREIAVQILRQRRPPREVVHYREWYALVTGAGVRIAGRDPLATFLTQVDQAPEESVRPDELDGIEVLATMVGGQWVHAGPPL